MIFRLCESITYVWIFLSFISVFCVEGGSSNLMRDLPIILFPLVIIWGVYYIGLYVISGVEKKE
jgi:hypothetical protein